MSGRLLQMSGIVIDLVHRIDHVPAAGEEVESPGVMVTAGGGFNAMAAAKRMGVEVQYGGSLGTGLFADIAIRMLDEEGISILLARRQPMDQGTCVVLVDRAGERSFISHHGAERHLDAAELDRVSFRPFDWLLLTGYSLFKEEGARVFLPWLQGLAPGPQFFFDPGPTIADIPGPALQTAMNRADWVSANRGEAKILTGLDDPAAAARTLSRGRKGALVRSGAEGCWISVAGEAAAHVPGFPVEAVDTNGAGDTHDGAFIAASCLGYGPGDAAILANAAAALATTKHGPATAPGFAETQSFLTSRGIQLATPQAVRVTEPRLGTTGRR